MFNINVTWLQKRTVALPSTLYLFEKESLPQDLFEDSNFDDKKENSPWNCISVAQQKRIRCEKFEGGFLEENFFKKTKSYQREIHEYENVTVQNGNPGGTNLTRRRKY